MVCTRKKDYGEPPVKKRKPPLTGQDLIVRSDAASGAGVRDDTRHYIACLSQGHCPPWISPRVFEQSNPRFERIDQSAGGSTNAKKYPLTYFPQFQKLPCEIRLLIWEASMTSQLVAVRPKPDGRRDTEHNGPKLFLPALFCVNSEARQRALRHYRWRFTLRLVALEPNPPPRQRIVMPSTPVQHARVVMSSHDTLGFMGWGFQNRSVCSWKIGIRGAGKTSPWEKQTTAHESQLEFGKVAILGQRLEADPRIIYDLNSAPCLDVDSILHARHWIQSRIIRGPWYNLEEKTYSASIISIRQFALTSNLEIWSEEVLRTVPGPEMFIEADLPDIMSFELMRKPKEGVDGNNFSLSAHARGDGYYYRWLYVWVHLQLIMP